MSNGSDGLAHIIAAISRDDIEVGDVFHAGDLECIGNLPTTGPALLPLAMDDYGRIWRISRGQIVCVSLGLPSGKP